MCGTGSSGNPNMPKVCWDGIASLGVIWDHVHFHTPNFAQCADSSGNFIDADHGLNIGRARQHNGTYYVASQHTFDDPDIQGCFAGMPALDNYASEVMRINKGTINNNSLVPGSQNIRIDCDNHYDDLTSITTRDFPSGQWGPCNTGDLDNTVSQKGQQDVGAVTMVNGNVLTFATVPPWVAAGMVAHDSSNPGAISYGHTITAVTTGSNGTITLGGSPITASPNDTVVLSTNDPGLWMDGNTGFSWHGGAAYLSTGSYYPIQVFYESAQPPSSLHFGGPDGILHIESYPNIVADVLVSGTSAVPSIWDLTRYDPLDEASFAAVVPDLAGGTVTNLQLNGIDFKIQPAGQVSSLLTQWGQYKQLSTAVVSTGGSGCTNGTQTFTVDGLNGLGIKGQVTGTVSSGFLSGSLTVVAPGIYITPVATPTLTGVACMQNPTITAGYVTLSAQTPISWATGRETYQNSATFALPANSLTFDIDGTNGGTTGRLIGTPWNEPNAPTGTNPGGTPMCFINNTATHGKCTNTQAGITVPSGATITYTQVLGGEIVRTGLTSARTDTLDTAQNIITRGSNVAVGTTFILKIYNQTPYIETIAMGSGETPVGNLTVPPNGARIFDLLVTGITSGSYAITVFGGPTDSNVMAQTQATLYTSSATITPPSGWQLLETCLMGGGGPGGNGIALTAGTGGSGGAGGGGAAVTCDEVVPSQVAGNLTLTLPSTATAGSNGGNTTMVGTGATLTAGGGGAGSNAVSGAANNGGGAGGMDQASGSTGGYGCSSGNSSLGSNASVECGATGGGSASNGAANTGGYGGYTYVTGCGGGSSGGGITSGPGNTAQAGANGHHPNLGLSATTGGAAGGANNGGNGSNPPAGQFFCGVPGAGGGANAMGNAGNGGNGGYGAGGGGGGSCEGASCVPGTGGNGGAPLAWVKWYF